MESMSIHLFISFIYFISYLFLLIHVKRYVATLPYQEFYVNISTSFLKDSFSYKSLYNTYNLYEIYNIYKFKYLNVEVIHM